MSNYNYHPGLGNVGSYQISGIPFIKNITLPQNNPLVVTVTFPSITRRIIIKNASTNSNTLIKFGFSEDGVNGNTFWALPVANIYNPHMIDMYVRVKKMFFRVYTAGNTNGAVAILAELTGIETKNLTNDWAGFEGVG